MNPPPQTSIGAASLRSSRASCPSSYPPPTTGARSPACPPGRVLSSKLLAEFRALKPAPPSCKYCPPQSKGVLRFMPCTSLRCKVLEHAPEDQECLSKFMASSIQARIPRPTLQRIFRVIYHTAMSRALQYPPPPPPPPPPGPKRPRCQGDVRPQQTGVVGQRGQGDALWSARFLIRVLRTDCDFRDGLWPQTAALSRVAVDEQPSRSSNAAKEL